jgi:hypothetical protein
MKDLNSSYPNERPSAMQILTERREYFINYDDVKASDQVIKMRKKLFFNDQEDELIFNVLSGKFKVLLMKKSLNDFRDYYKLKLLSFLDGKMYFPCDLFSNIIKEIEMGFENVINSGDEFSFVDRVIFKRILKQVIKIVSEENESHNNKYEVYIGSTIDRDVNNFILVQYILDYFMQYIKYINKINIEYIFSTKNY